MALKTFATSLMIIFFTGLCAGDLCEVYDDDDEDEMDYIACDTGCCGTRFDRECCETDDLPVTPLLVALIVLGCVLAVLVVVGSVVVGLCFCRKSRRQTAGVIVRAPQNNTEAGHVTQGTGQDNSGFSEESFARSRQFSVSMTSLPPSYEEAILQPCFSSTASINTGFDTPTPDGATDTDSFRPSVSGDTECAKTPSDSGRTTLV